MADSPYEIFRGVDKRVKPRTLADYLRRINRIKQGTPLAIVGACETRPWVVPTGRAAYTQSGDVFLLRFGGAKVLHRTGVEDYIKVYPRSGEGREDSETQVIDGLERIAFNEVAVSHGHDFSCLIPYVLDCVRSRIPVDEGCSTDVALLTGGDALFTEVDALDFGLDDKP